MSIHIKNAFDLKFELPYSSTLQSLEMISYVTRQSDEVNCKKLIIVHNVPSKPNTSFPLRCATLPFIAFIRFFIPMYSTISGESPLICFPSTNNFFTDDYMMKKSISNSSGNKLPNRMEILQ